MRGLAWPSPCVGALSTCWTNLGDAGHLQRVTAAHRAAPTAPDAAHLLPIRVLPVTDGPMPKPYLACNTPGRTVRALPPQPHLLQLSLQFKGSQRSEPLHPQELERLVGLAPGSTAHPGVPPAAQCQAIVTGVCAPVVHHLIVFAFVTPHHMAVLRPRVVDRPLGGELEQTASAVGGPPEQVSVALAVSVAATSTVDEAAHAVLAAAVTEQQERAVLTVQQQSAALRDIWADAPALEYVKQQHCSPQLQGNERVRVLRRAQDYLWQGDRLYRKMADGATREVPPPHERRALIELTHERLGHFGIRRTLGLLSLAYWWYGMKPDVTQVVGECKACDQAKTVGAAEPAAMQPSLIRGLGYRWHVDLTGPLHTTARGNKYVLIAVESFSKQIELYPLPSKGAVHTARAFLEVASRYSSPAEVVTDQGTEWEAEFAALLEQLLVDHRRTSANHPQANGSAERVVQMVKKALRKVIMQQPAKSSTWDDELPWIALGYRCAPQRATGYSPYELLYGVKPVVPPAMRERLSAQLEFEDPDKLAAALAERAEAMQHVAPAAGGNLLISQHRDMHRYARVRAAGYKPRFVRYEPGDYVYVVQRNRNSTLEMPTYDQVLRVVRVDKSGVATLRGRCGTERKEHLRGLRPCHLHNIDPIVDPRISRPPLSHACEVCGSPDSPAKMVLCPTCGAGWHTFCLDPPLKRVPVGTWVCPDCVAAGVTPEQVEAMPAPVPREEEHKRVRLPSAAQKRRHEEYAKLEGRAVRRVTGDTDEPGVVRYRGWAAGQEPFEVVFQDGSRELFSVRELNKILLPAGAGQGGRTRRKGSTGARVLASREQLEHWRGVQSAWGHMAPDAGCSSEEAAAWARMFRELEAGQHRPLGVHVPRHAYSRLLECVDMPLLLLDPWATAGEPTAELRRRGFVVWRNAWEQAVPAESHERAWLPGLYERVQGTQGLWGVVTAPRQELVEWALPLAVSVCPVVAVLVPAVWLASAPPVRRAYLQGLEEEGRLLLVKLPPFGAAARVAVWVVVFESAEARRRLSRVSFELDQLWVNA